MISVLMPVRNAADSLPAALESLTAQTLPDFEVIAVDDGSTDGRTPDILEAYARRDSRIRPTLRPHAGLRGALRTALAHASGDLLARMDADDVCSPERLELQAAFLDANPDVGLAGCRVLFGGDPVRAGGYKRYVDWTNTLLSHDDIFLECFRESPFAHPCVMFRRSVVEQHGFYADGPFPEDYELWLRWLDAGVRMEKLPQTLLTWNDPPQRLSRTHPDYDTTRFHEVKARYLARRLERINPHHPVVHVVGGGRTTRKRAENLLDNGIEIAAWLDIDPNKINKTVAGRPVLHHEQAPPPDKCFIVSYVAGHGAAESVFNTFTARGFVPGRNLLFAA